MYLTGVILCSAIKSASPSKSLGSSIPYTSVYGTAVIKPQEKVKAVKIVFDGMSDALITSFQNLRIEK